MRSATSLLLRSEACLDANPGTTMRLSQCAISGMFCADSGDISLQEMREMLEQIFPDVTRVQFATIMKDLRGLADNNNSYDEQSFLDAVMLAFQVRGPKSDG